jgi:hypothetical protein
MPIRTLRFRQSGGFAGLVRGTEVSADKDISAADRRALERYVKDARAPSPAGAPGARDLIVYEFDVDTDAGQVRFEFDEASVPADLAALVEQLAKRARPMPP